MILILPCSPVTIASKGCLVSHARGLDLHNYRYSVDCTPASGVNMAIGGFLQEAGKGREEVGGNFKRRVGSRHVCVLSTFVFSRASDISRAQVCHWACMRVGNDAHLSQISLCSCPLKQNLDTMLIKTPDLIEAMIELACSRRWLQTTIYVIDFSQCVVQGLWLNDHNLRQVRSYKLGCVQ